MHPEPNQIYILAHHGTCKYYKKRIDENGFAPSRGTKHWLGDGVYFFREDEEQAKTWAEVKSNFLQKRKQFSNPEDYKVYVSKTCFWIHEDSFLNLDSRGGLIEFIEFANALYRQASKRGVTSKYDISKSGFAQNHQLFRALPPEVKLIQRTFPVESRFDDEHKFPFSLIGFIPIKRGKEDISGEKVVKQGNDYFRKTPALQGQQLVVRDVSLLQQANISWLAC